MRVGLTPARSASIARIGVLERGRAYGLNWRSYAATLTLRTPMSQPVLQQLMTGTSGTAPLPALPSGIYRLAVQAADPLLLTQRIAVG